MDWSAVAQRSNVRLNGETTRLNRLIRLDAILKFRYYLVLYTPTVTYYSSVSFSAKN